MPFSTDNDDIPDAVPVRLPAGTWEEEEVILLKPYFDAAAQQTALAKSLHEVQDGHYADGRPRTKYERDQGLYQIHLVLGQIKSHSLRNAPTAAQKKAGKPGSKAKLTVENLPLKLGVENFTYLISLINEMAGEPPGGYVIKGANGRPESFRIADHAPDRGGTDDVRAPEHDRVVERGPDSGEDQLGLLPAGAAAGEVAR